MLMLLALTNLTSCRAIVDDRAAKQREERAAYENRRQQETIGFEQEFQRKRQIIVAKRLTETLLLDEWDIFLYHSWSRIGLSEAEVIQELGKPNRTEFDGRYWYYTGLLKDRITGEKRTLEILFLGGQVTHVGEG